MSRELILEGVKSTARGLTMRSVWQHLGVEMSLVREGRRLPLSYPQCRKILGRARRCLEAQICLGVMLSRYPMMWFKRLFARLKTWSVPDAGSLSSSYKPSLTTRSGTLLPEDRPSLETIQGWLYVLHFDGYVADAFTSGLVNSRDSYVRWQAAVDTLYRLAACGLIRSEGYVSKASLLTYVDNLSKADPFTPNDLPVVWIETDVCTTELCEELMEHWGVIATEGHKNLGFENELLRIFACHDVPFDEYPIKCIVKEGGGDRGQE